MNVTKMHFDECEIPWNGYKTIENIKITLTDGSLLEQILAIDLDFDYIESCEVSFAPPQIDSMLLFFNVLVHCHYYLLVFDNN